MTGKSGAVIFFYLCAMFRKNRHIFFAIFMCFLVLTGAMVHADKGIFSFDMELASESHTESNDLFSEIDFIDEDQATRYSRSLSVNQLVVYLIVQNETPIADILSISVWQPPQKS